MPPLRLVLDGCRVGGDGWCSPENVGALRKMPAALPVCCRHFPIGHWGNPSLAGDQSLVPTRIKNNQSTIHLPTNNPH